MRVEYRALLATRLLRVDEFVSVSELVERLWTGTPPGVESAKADDARELLARVG